MHGNTAPADIAPRPVRVLLLLASLHGGGAERVAAHLHARLDPTRFDVRMGLLRASGPYLDQVDPQRLLVAPDGDARFNYDGTNRAQYRPATLIRGAIQAPLAFSQMIRATQPDVVMSFLKGTNLLTWLSLVGMRRRPSWIAREGNNMIAVAREEAPSPAIARLSIALTRRAYNRADAVLANSSDMAAGLIADLGIDPARMRMINNPIDLQAISAAVDQPIPAMPNRPFILTAGRLEYQKGQEVLIRAFAESGLARSHALVVLGKGSRLAGLHRLAAQLGVGENVRFIGFVANPYAWMARAELFVLPSRWEGFPTAAAEAMASGAPLLLSDCSYGPRDIVDPGVNGELVPVDDVPALAAAMAGLIADPARRARYAEAGRIRVRGFALETMIARYGELFAELARTRSGHVRVNPPVAASPALERP